MNKEKLFYKNTGIIAIGTLSSKLFTFFLLPLYTAVLLPDDFGTVDVLHTIISLLLYFATLQLEAAVFRFIIERRDKHDSIGVCITTAFFTEAFALLVTTLVLGIIDIVYPIPHFIVFILCIWSNAFSIFMLNSARGLGDNVLYSVASFLITLSSLIVNLVLILGIKLGAVSILIAIVVSNVLGGSVVAISIKAWKYLSPKYYNRGILGEMLNYSLPLIPNAISWWIANVSDRLLIVFFIGAAANGVYAAANKIPAIYTTIFNVINLAWMESISLAVINGDHKSFVSEMMNKGYRFLSFLCLGIVCCVSLFFEFIIGSNYSDSYWHIYILMIAIFVNSLCSLYGGILAAFKDSKTTGSTTVTGAIVNFIVNIVLIKVIGLYAASLSTLVSYSVILLLRSKASKKYVDIKYNNRFSLQLLAMMVVVSIGYLFRSKMLNCAVFIVLCIWGFLNNTEIIKTIAGMILKKKGEQE